MKINKAKNILKGLVMALGMCVIGAIQYFIGAVLFEYSFAVSLIDIPIFSYFQYKWLTFAIQKFYGRY